MIYRLAELSLELVYGLAFFACTCFAALYMIGVIV